jgi:hypothetical protein
MGIMLLLVTESFKVGFDGERHNSGRTVGEVMFESFLIGSHLDCFACKI